MTRKHFVLAMAISPLSPLKKKAKNRITKKDDNKRIKSDTSPKEMFRFAQHDKWRCDPSRTHCVIASEHIGRAWQPTGKESS